MNILFFKTILSIKGKERETKTESVRNNFIFDKWQMIIMACYMLTNKMESNVFVPHTKNTGA